MLKVDVAYQVRNGGWQSVGVLEQGNRLCFHNSDLELSASCVPESENVAAYDLEFRSVYPTRIRLLAELEGGNPWHLIPCCIHGDNNLHHARPDQYPNLTREHSEAEYSSPLWEFRADRASHPVSILTTDSAVGGVSIDPYSHDLDGQLIRNGVFAELPNRFGVTFGYANLPFTFVNKRCDYCDGISKSTSNPLCGGRVAGKLFFYPDGGRGTVKKIIENLYRASRECPHFKRSFREAAQAVLDSFVRFNYSVEFGHYTNQEAHPPAQPELKPWRPLIEIGWTGGSILAYPFITAMDTLKLPDDFFRGRKSGYELFDEILKHVDTPPKWCIRSFSGKIHYTSSPSPSQCPNCPESETLCFTFCILHTILYILFFARCNKYEFGFFPLSDPAAEGKGHLPALGGQGSGDLPGPAQPL